MAQVAGRSAPWSQSSASVAIAERNRNAVQCDVRRLLVFDVRCLSIGDLRLLDSCRQVARQRAGRRGPDVRA